VLYCLRDVVILAVGFREFFMSFALLVFILVFLAEHQEFREVFNRSHHVSLLFADQTDLLVAFSFFVHVVGLLRHVNTLLIKLQRHFILRLILVFLRNLLVDTDQVLEDLYLDSIQVALSRFGKCSFELTHGLKLIEDIFFTKAETFIC